MLDVTESGFLIFIGKYPKPLTVKARSDCHPPAFTFHDGDNIVAIHHKNESIGKEDTYLIGFENWGPEE